MQKTTLNFFGEEVVIDTPKDMASLRSKICEKYLFSPSDASEIILYYVKENKKVYIINGDDFQKFKDSKVPTLFLDVNQNSRLYINNSSEMEKEKQKSIKELEELNHKYNKISKKKEKIEHTFVAQLKEINLKIMEMNKIKCEIIKRKDIESIKLIKEKEIFEEKMYYLQKKLALPITVPIPKEEKPKKTSTNNSPKKSPLLLNFKNSLRHAPMKNLETQKTLEIAKCKAIAAAKAFALNGPKMDIKTNKEIQKKIENVKLKSIAKAQKAALNIARIHHNEIINNKSEIQKKIEIAKSKSIAKAQKQALIVGENAKKEEKKEKEQNIPINTVSVFKKVNEVLGNSIEKVKEVAKNAIMKGAEEPKKEEIKDEKEKLKKEEEEKKLKEKEKKEQIEKIIKITKDTIKEINNLTKMVITQSNLFIEQINNPEKKLNLSSDDVILKATKKEKKRVTIHCRITCDGCKMFPIRGNRYKCKGCKDFDFCESCYQKNKESHGHEFTKIEKPGNTKRIGHKNTKYCGRGIVHRNIRCESCGLDPLVGWRYMCTICDDFNLCENCEEQKAVKHGHPFIKVSYPSLLDSFNNCYLKLNYYDGEIKI